MLSNFTPNFGSNFQPSGGFDDIMLGGDNIYPTLDAFFAHDKAFTVDEANPGGCLITSRRGPDAKFSRASGRTFTDSDGLVKWAAENKLLWSQNPVNAFGLISVPLPSSISGGPLGTVWELGVTAGAGFHIYRQTTSVPEAKIHSVLVKRGVSRYLNLGAGNAATWDWEAMAWVAAGIDWAGLSVEADPFGDGWYWLSVKAAVMGEGYFDLVPTNTLSQFSFTADGTEHVFFAAGKIHRSPCQHLPTTSAPVYGPAFEHDPVTGVCLGLSRWEQRTNLCLQSEDFTAWNPAGIYTATPNASTGPNGQISADQLDIPPKSGGTYGAVFPNIGASLTVASVYTFSVWLKGATGTEVVWLMWTPDGSTYSRTQCALTTGWQRFELQFTADAGANYLQLGVDSRDTVGGQSSLVAQTFYAWGAQLELGSAMSSYIPTTTAPVVRSADVCSIDGADFAGFYNQSEGTMVLDFDAENKNDSSVVIIHGASLAEVIYVGTNNTSLYTTSIIDDNAYRAILLQVDPVVTGVRHKLASSWKLNDCAASLDGATPITDSVATMPTLTALSLSGFSGNPVNNGNIARLTYYPKRLSNAKIQSLTA